MGTGKAPHYRFDQVSEVTFDFLSSDVFLVKHPVAVFNGRNHEPLVPEGEEPDILHDRNWSTKGLTLAEVEDVFRKIRGLKR